MVAARTTRQCRQRWVESLDRLDSVVRDGLRVWTPLFIAGKWTVEDDAKLTEAVTEFHNDWVRAAELVPASGDALKDAVVIWTRYTPENVDDEIDLEFRMAAVDPDLAVENHLRLIFVR
jgi:hypothetical protein